MKEAVIARIKECESVVNDLEQSGAWSIVIKDVGEIVKDLDMRWQYIKEEDKNSRLEARVMKLAALHIMDLPNRYKNELIKAQQDLERIEDGGKTQTTRDYDTETKIEPGKGDIYGY